MIHFTTTIEGAQVVVAGNANGHITWYIAQPPMKTYTVLSSSKEHSPHKVTSLQVRLLFGSGLCWHVLVFVMHFDKNLCNPSNIFVACSCKLNDSCFLFSNPPIVPNVPLA